MRHIKKPLFILLTLCMIAGLLPWMAVDARAENEVTVTANGSTVSEATTWENCTVNVTGSGTITYSDRITVSGSVTLNLGADATLTAGKGIGISNDGTLTITGSGTLDATGYYDDHSGYTCAGIGSSSGIGGGGNLIINGGSITASEEGIICNGLSVTGGTVNAVGSPAIYAKGDIGITGGSVTATTNDDNKGSGICSDSNITITGGTVNATGGINGNGIFAGSITLGWTDFDHDSYKASAWGAGTMTVQVGQSFALYSGGVATGILQAGTVSDYDFIAIAGKTLRPKEVVANEIIVSIARGGAITAKSADGGQTLISAPQNTSVALTITPHEGYSLVENSLSVTDKNGGAVAVANNTFTMPDGYVIVTATFVSEWGLLQAQFDSASETEGSPTVITLDKDYTAALEDAALSIPAGKYITLDLNGHTLDRGFGNSTNYYSDGNVLTVNGSLTLRGSGTITGGRNNREGGGVTVNGSLVMQGGTITGNAAEIDGGGVAVNGSLVMQGGTITGNSAEGNYKNEHYSVFGRGGGVYVVNNGTFTMFNGSITGNTADLGGGVYVSSTATFNISGSPVITDNNLSNVGFSYLLDTDILISVTGALADGASIGITARPSHNKFAAGVNYTISDDDLTKFHDDEDNTTVARKDTDGKAFFGKALTDAMIAAISDQTYTGNAIEPALTVTDGDTALIKDKHYTVTYSDNTEPGTATATFTGAFGGIYEDHYIGYCYQGYYDTVSKTFTIVKATPTISAVPTASAITYGQTLGSSTLTGGTVTGVGNDGVLAGKWSWADGNTAPAVSDSGTTEYEVTFEPDDATHYESVTTTIKLTVYPKAVTITAQDKAFTYSGEAQSWNQYDVDGLVGSDAISAVVTGKHHLPQPKPGHERADEL